MQNTDFDIVIIGSGPGGYVAAIRASQLGHSVAIVERAEIGGVCLNWGCIPTKALLKSAQVYSYMSHCKDYGVEMTGEVKPNFEQIIARSRTVAETMNKGVAFLLNKHKVTVIQGFGRLVAPNRVEILSATGDATLGDASENTSYITARHVVIATGSRPKELPFIPVDRKRVITSREAMTLPVQPQSMIVVGSGAIGCEFAHFYNSIGTKVTIVEYLPNLLPLEDEDVSKQIERSMRKAKIDVMVSTTVKNVVADGDRCRVEVESKKGAQTLEADVVLSAVGVKSNIEGVGLEDLGVAVHGDKIVVDEFYRTNIEGVYAIGDIVRGPALAHVASAEAICCIEKISQMDVKPIDYGNIPSCVYTAPEVASVGMTEKQAVDQGFEVKIGKFPYTASGKATAAGERDGFVKLVIDAQSDTVLGAHMVGANVTEMIAEPTMVRALGGKAMQIIKTIHSHPTMNEAVMEAAAAAHNEAIHI